MEEKLSDTTTYMKIDKDPTMEIKKELASQLQELLKEEIIDKNLHRQLYPNRTQITRAYGSPKIHKEGYPLREIVDSTNSVAKSIDKYVSRVIKTYTEGSPHAIRNSAHLVEEIKELKVEQNEKLILGVGYRW